MSAFIDARDDNLPGVLHGTVCVVGAGAAGLTLARSLAASGIDVLLVEAGGQDIEGRTQNLYAGQQLGLPYYNLTTCRLRYFGGTTNHWSGYCRDNDPIDYQPRPEAGLPGWPINEAALEPYVARAAAELDLPGHDLDPSARLRERGLDPAQLIDGPETPLRTKVFQLSQNIRLGPRYRDDIAASERITPVLNLNVTHIQLTPEGNRVQHLEAATLTGQRTRIEADHFVLCCHAIENARLLMLSDDVMPMGVGNAHDHVGRYFMDHAQIEASRFIPSAAFPAIYDRRQAMALHLNANLSLTEDFLRDQALPQYYCRFNPEYMTPEAYRSKVDLRRRFMEPGDLDYLRDIANVLGELGGMIDLERVERGDFRPPLYYRLEHRIEQTPNPDSRVVLSDRTDALGLRIADLDWRLNDHDIRAFRDGQAAIGREMAALGLGRLEAEEITRDLVEDRVAGHYHHIGTTRMSDSPAQGVVSADLTVHGIANLHIGGSSVFPTAGYSGPTMMIMALALRQAEHIKALAT